MDNYSNPILPGGNDNFTLNQFEHSSIQAESRNIVAAFEHGLVSGDGGKKEWTNGDHLESNWDGVNHAPAKLLEQIYVTCFTGTLSTTPQTIAIPDNCFAYEVMASQLCMVTDTSPRQWTLDTLANTINNGNITIGKTIPVRFARRKGVKELYISMDTSNLVPVSQTFVQIRFLHGSNGASKDLLNWL